MGKLSDEEKATLDALTKKANEADDDDDFDVEWWEEDEKGNRRGGRIPWSKGKSIYGKHFPDLFADKPKADEGKPPEENPPKQRTSEKYFGNRD